MPAFHNFYIISNKRLSFLLRCIQSEIMSSFFLHKGLNRGSHMAEACVGPKTNDPWDSENNNSLAGTELLPLIL
jgi:hypothetical protein